MVPFQREGWAEGKMDDDDKLLVAVMWADLLRKARQEVVVEVMVEVGATSLVESKRRPDEVRETM